MGKRKRHGMRNTRMYGVWLNMKERCYNPKHRYFSHYGGKGIEVCNEWRVDFLSFYKWATANGYADNLTIDRIDGNKNYSPENCRWITIQEQQNNRCNNFNVEINGETKNLAQWSAFSGVSRGTIYSRYQKGVRGADLLKIPRRK